MKKPRMIPTEAEEQAALFQWAEREKHAYPGLGLMFHIKNEGNRRGQAGALDGARNKAQGVKSGVPDIFLPVPRKGFHGLFIEMKAQDGRASETQLVWLDELNEKGYLAVVCRGWIAAANTIKDYLGI